MTITEYIRRIPEFGALCSTPTKLVPYFALFLELQDAERPVFPGSINRIFDDARVRRPANTSDAMRRSGAFVSLRSGGYRLAHQSRESLISSLAERDEPVNEKPKITGSADIHLAQGGSGDSTHSVFVVYGRDPHLRRDLFSFLRAVGVRPLEFEEMAHLTGSTSPSTWEVLQAGFAHAQACIVLFSPDESVILREDLQGPDDSGVPELQPRPNVLIEAGMALALQPKRTVIVKVGHVREISDLDGMQYVNLTGSAESRNKLLNKLKLAGCSVRAHGDDWLSVGNFKVDSQGGAYGDPGRAKKQVSRKR